MLDAILAILHHLAIFSLAGIIAMELALLRPGIAGPRLQGLARLDGFYGLLAVLVVAVGVCRVYFGDKGADYYFGNWAFWAKMGAFVLVGLLSIQPTIALVRWRKAGSADATFTPPETGIARSRRFLLAEAVIFFLIPTFAALMARGIGL